jgi:hypothetical protein
MFHTDWLGSGWNKRTGFKTAKRLNGWWNTVSASLADFFDIIGLHPDTRNSASKVRQKSFTHLFTSRLLPFKPASGNLRRRWLMQSNAE